MTLREILDAEASRPIPLIYLYKEGTFYKAYEMSAFYLCTVRGLKPVKRWCKSLECEYVTAGFPITSVMKYLPEAVISEDHCQHTDEDWGFILNDRDREFVKWKASLPVHVPKKKEDEKEKCPMVTAEIMNETGNKKAYEMLSVYKRIYDLLLRFTKQRMRLEREYRYTVGQNIFEHLTVLLMNVYKANGEKETESKLAIIDQMLEILVKVKIYFRLLCDTKQISVKSFANTTNDVVAIEKELKSWAAYQKK